MISRPVGSLPSIQRSLGDVLSGRELQVKIIKGLSHGSWLIEVKGKTIQAYSRIPLKAGMFLRGKLFYKQDQWRLQLSPPQKMIARFLNQYPEIPSGEKGQHLLKTLLLSETPLSLSAVKALLSLYPHIKYRSLGSFLTAHLLSSKMGDGAAFPWLLFHALEDDFHREGRGQQGGQRNPSDNPDEPSSEDTESLSVDMDNGQGESADAYRLFNALSEAQGTRWKLYPVKGRMAGKVVRGRLWIALNPLTRDVVSALLELDGWLFRFRYIGTARREVVLEESPPEGDCASLVQSVKDLDWGFVLQSVGESGGLDLEV